MEYVPLQIEIFDSLGNSVKRLNNGKEYSGILQTINLNDLPEGIYFIKINTSIGVVTKKILKVGSGGNKA